MIVIDGTTYNVNVTAIKRKAPFLDKYAKRTEDGNLQRKLIGVFRNYEMTFAETDPASYAALYDKLNEPVPYHAVRVPGLYGWETYTMYCSEVDDEVTRYDASTGKASFKELKVEFIAKAPARTP